MKSALFSVLLVCASAGSSAGILNIPAAVGLSPTGAAYTPSIEAANRKGSTRVGGSGRSGKGGHYVGGRRR